MGVVYRAFDPRTGRHVALKLLLDTSVRFRQRFAREARLLARLRHPNVVRVHDAGESQGRPYIVMELVEGTNLAEELRRGPMDPRRAARLVASVARGAGQAHADGLVHRDIKPANVLLRPDGEAVLSDFGLARDVEVTSELSKTGFFMGTPGYASPEQARGEAKHVGPATDVYGLGALLFALLCARPPFTGPLIEVLVHTISDPAPSPRAHNDGVDTALDALCQRCLAKAPAERYADANVLADALEAYLRGELAAPPRDRRPAYVALGLLALGVLVGVLVVRRGRPAAPVASSSPAAEATSATRVSAAPTPGEAPPPSALESSGVLTRALSRTAERPAGPRGGEELDAAIALLTEALERVGPASNRPEAERRLAALHTRRSESLILRTPEQIVADLRAALALESTAPRRQALAEALLRQAYVAGGDMATGVEWERAKELYREAMACSPDDPRPALVLGDQARSRKDWETWLSANEEAARRAPDDEAPQVQIARALKRAERGAEAVDRLRRFVAAHPEALAAWGELGDQERARGRWGSARGAYERAGGEDSAAAAVLEGLAWVALEEQRNGLALELCERALTGGRPPSRLVAVRALARHRTGDLEGALPDYEAAWSAEESEPLLLDLALGHLDALRSLKQDADSRLRLFLDEPRFGRHGALVAQVIHYASTDRDPPANQALRGVLRPRGLALNPRADCALSEWLSRWGTYDLPESALGLAQRAARLSSDDEDAAAYVLLGRALMRLKRYDDAWSALDEALEIHPTRADLHHTRTELGATSGRYELGLESGRRAREYLPQNPYVCVYIAWSLLALGRSQDALPLTDFVVSKLGDRAAGLRALARAGAGTLEGAREDLMRARAHDPQAREVRLAEAELLLQDGEDDAASAALRELQQQPLQRYEADLVARLLERASQR